MPRFAAIDIGSNSVKLLIVERAPAGELTLLEDTGVTTRLGEGIHLRRLREAAIRRTLDCLEVMATRCRDLGVERAAAVGTSALRDACNRREFVERAAEFGLAVEPISGDEEARLSFLAVRRDPLWRDSGPLAVLDIGGGSTEFILSSPSGAEMDCHASLRLGAVRLSEDYLDADPPSVRQLAQTAQAARADMEGLSSPPVNYTLVGVGGTLLTLASVRLSRDDASMHDLHGSRLTAAEVEAQIDQYASLTLDERREIVGLNPARADIILGGAIILREAMSRMNRDSLLVSCRGLRWGLMYDQMGRQAAAGQAASI